MQGQGSPNNNYNYSDNSNNNANLTSFGAFNKPTPTTPTPQKPISCDGFNHGVAQSEDDFWNFDEDLLLSLLDNGNLGQDGGGVCLMDHGGRGGGELENNYNVGRGNSLLLEEEGGGGINLMDQIPGRSDEGGELEDYNNDCQGKSCLLDGSSEGNEKNKKRGAPCYNLAEIWPKDPDRAKRLLEGRRYMARAREKKVRYLSELEEKAQLLEFEATNFSAQLVTCQRDKRGLTRENAELKVLLEVKQQQAELRDALSEALKQEVEKLKISNGGIQSPSELSTFGVLPSSPLALRSPSRPPTDYYKLSPSPSTSLPHMQHNLLTSPSTLQPPMSYNPLTSSSALQSPLKTSPFASPSPSTLKTMSNHPAPSPSPRTRNYVFPLPKMSSSVLSQLHNSGSSLLSRRGHPTNLPTPSE